MAKEMNKMNDIIKKIFEMLGVEPNEEFRLTDLTGKYKFNECLQLYTYDSYNNFWTTWQNESPRLNSILTGNFNIIKLKKWTKEEEIIAKYLKLIGYKWIIKDKDWKIFAYKDKPIKHSMSGFWSLENSRGCSIQYNMPNIKWEDTEPTYIDDILGDE